MKFLIVDDDDDFLHLVAILVNACNPTASIAMARDGEDALALIAKGLLPAIVITDITMPRLDGNELCNSLRSRFGDSIKIIAMTRSPSTEIEADFDAILAKPFTSKILFAALDGMMIDKDLGTPSLNSNAG